jgi:hypothetical protein
MDQAQSEHYYTHVGESMIPTLKALDQVYTASDRQFRPGDIIIFTIADKRKIVHRIVSINDGKIVTQGDNNPGPDRDPVSPENVLGKVAYARREGKKISVRGGWAGKMSIVPHRVSLKARAVAAVIIVMPYHALARSGIFRALLPGRLKPQIMTIRGSKGPELRVMIGKRLAGKWYMGLPGWQIRPPYKLFIDMRSLPEVPSCGGACSTKGASGNDLGNDGNDR